MCAAGRPRPRPSARRPADRPPAAAAAARFYCQYVLAKKGPLGNIWLAANMDKKLSKNGAYR